jgi:hypothetical protein
VVSVRSQKLSPGLPARAWKAQVELTRAGRQASGDAFFSIWESSCLKFRCCLRRSVTTVASVRVSSPAARRQRAFWRFSEKSFRPFLNFFRLRPRTSPPECKLPIGFTATRDCSPPDRCRPFSAPAGQRQRLLTPANPVFSPCPN